LRRDEDHEREARRPVRHARGQQTNRRDRDRVRHLELQHAAVFRLLHVEPQKAAPGDDSRVDRQPDADRRLELLPEVERPEVAILERDRRLHADAIDRERERTERAGEANTNLDDGSRRPTLRLVAKDRHRQRLHPDRSNRAVRRDGCGEAQALETETGAA
jgi:hypothetical protein